MPEPLELRFDLPAPPDAVFAAWTEASQVLAWWRDSGVYRTVAWQADVRPGGAWRAEFIDVSGDVSTAQGRYVTVERPTRLVWTWRDSWTPDVESTIDMTFAAAGAGTAMTLVETSFASADDRADNVEAWTAVTGWLADYLQGRRAR